MNYPLVRIWLYWGMFWLMAMPTVGVDDLGHVQPRLSGRRIEYLVRPAAAGPCQRRDLRQLLGAVFGLCYYLVPRLSGVRMHAEPLGYWMAWAWNIVLALGLLSLPLGYNQGLEAGELPFLADFLLFILIAAMTWQFTVTIANRVEPQLYVSLWYLLATFWWTTINMILGTFILPFTIQGSTAPPSTASSSTISSGCGSPRRVMSDLLFLPVSARNPLFSHKLSLVGFWSLACSIRSSASTTTSTARSPTGPRPWRSSPRCS